MKQMVRGSWLNKKMRLVRFSQTLCAYYAYLRILVFRLSTSARHANFSTRYFFVSRCAGERVSDINLILTWTLDSSLQTHRYNGRATPSRRLDDTMGKLIKLELYSKILHSSQVERMKRD